MTVQTLLDISNNISGSLTNVITVRLEHNNVLARVFMETVTIHFDNFMTGLVEINAGMSTLHRITNAREEFTGSSNLDIKTTSSQCRDDADETNRRRLL